MGSESLWTKLLENLGVFSFALVALWSLWRFFRAMLNRIPRDGGAA